MQFPGFDERVREVRERIDGAVRRGGRNQSVAIVAVTKTYGPEAITAAWNAGIRAVGENRMQEALDKMTSVSEPVDWHLIGHLQRNKVKHLDRFSLFHALDSERLALAVDDLGRGRGRPVPVLVQVNTSGEETKGGFGLETLRLIAPKLKGWAGLDVRGAMTMAPFDAPERVLRETFAGCRDAAGILREVGLNATELSMGMSGDYEIAVEEGATMVRLGTILFGARTP
jgi:pyridoxal phosphate enzyme (YggS family)